MSKSHSKQRIIPDESRQVHHGLQQMTQKLRQNSGAISTSPDLVNYQDRSISAVGFEEQSFDTTSPYLVAATDNNVKYSQEITGAQASDPHMPDSTATRAAAAARIGAPVHELISQKLYRQKTGNAKSISRKLRDMQYDNEEQSNLLEVDDEA